MEASAFENINVTVREMADWKTLFDRIHYNVVVTAQEAQRESVLTPEYKRDLLEASTQLSDQNAAMKEMTEALKTTKDKAMQETLEIRSYFNNKVAELRENRKEEEDAVAARLKAVLEQKDGATRATEQIIDVAPNLSLVVDEENSQMNRKCPITLKPIVNPYRNRHCKHVFEKVAVLGYIRNIRRHGGTVRCAVAGCLNKNQFTEKDFDDDPTFHFELSQF